MQCGGDTEQKVNGVISYMPLASSGSGPIPHIQLVTDDGPEKT